MARWVKCTTFVGRKDVYLNPDRIVSLTTGIKSTWVKYGVGEQADENVVESAEHILALLGDEVLDAQRAPEENHPTEVVGDAGG